MTDCYTQFYNRLESLGHKLKRDGSGNVDFFALDSGYHNGPECVLCGESWCEHCENNPTECTHKETTCK